MPKPNRKQKPGVTIVGAGRLGTALAIALSRRSYSIQTMVGRRLSNAKRAAALLDVPVRVLAAKELGKLEVSKLVIVSTPDDQIASVVESLRGLQRTATVLHTSGALSSGVLTPLAKRGWNTGSIHPLVSVSDPLIGAASFEGAFWCAEGSPKALQLGRRLVRDLEGHSFSISDTAKPLYHAAAVMASGNVAALFDVAIDMLSQCGLTRPDSKRVLLPLLETTLSNLTKLTPAAALTGTMARGDIATVRRHLHSLKGKRLETARALYCLLGSKALLLAVENGLDRKVADQIRRELK
jgi:predicted short-subunit dehydrogenase-like oxidoreductase (DUF2520 family)